MSTMNYILPVALLFSGAVNAANENPWYAGARLGGAHYSNLSSEQLNSDQLERDDWAGGIFLGYNIKSWLAIESGYTYLGETEFNNVGSVEQQGIDLVGKFTWKTTDSFDVFAKAGGFYYFADGDDLLSAYDDRGVVATAGLGLEYHFSKNMSTRLEYQFYNNIELKDADIDMHWDTHFYGLSLVYSWGAPAAMITKEKVMSEPEPQPVVESKPMVEPEPIAEAAPMMIKIEPLTVDLPFAFNSGELSKQYLDQLIPVTEHLATHKDAKLFVVGHTDSRGSEAYNQKLSEQRAALIGDYLATHYDIDKSRIVEEGHGELNPIASNETAEGRAQNRRVSVFTPGLEIQHK